MEFQNLLAVSRGDIPADLVLKNAKVVNTFIAEIEEADVAVFDGVMGEFSAVF